MIWLNNKFVKLPTIWLLLISLLLVQTGCIQYYRVADVDYGTSGELSDNELFDFQVYHYFVHVGDEVFQLERPTYSSSSDLFTAATIALNKDVYDLYENALERKSGYIHKKGSVSTYEVKQLHFYVSELSKNEAGGILFTKNDITTVHILKNAYGLSTIVTSSVVAVTIASGIAIFLAIACSCPHIYIKQEEESFRIANAFVGSVSKTLEAEDYSLINLSPEKPFELQIVNEEIGETHYINKVKLLQITHNESVNILPDQSGEIHTIGDIALPSNEMVSEKNDGLKLEFETIDAKTGLSEIELTFQANDQANDQAKLILSAKNSYWASHVGNEWYQLMGSELNQVKQDNAKLSAERQLKWQEKQGITLSVYVKNGKKWDFQEAVNIVGNTVYRDLVIPIALPKNSDGKTTIKLSAGFKLWDVDYVGLDYSEDLPVTIKEVDVPNANTLEKLETIASNDDDYTVLNYGDTLKLNYGQLESNETISHVLNMKGYYTKAMDQVGEYKKKEVKSFRSKAQMSKYSYHLYHEALTELMSSK